MESCHLRQSQRASLHFHPHAINHVRGERAYMHRVLRPHHLPFSDTLQNGLFHRRQARVQGQIATVRGYRLLHVAFRVKGVRAELDGSRDHISGNIHIYISDALDDYRLNEALSKLSESTSVNTGLSWLRICVYYALNTTTKNLFSDVNSANLKGSDLADLVYEAAKFSVCQIAAVLSSQCPRTAAQIDAAADKPLVNARCTPLEKNGSMKAPASPTMR